MGEQLSLDFDVILAEARKFALYLAGLANQYVDQLDRSVRHAIFGNVGTLVAFRLGIRDASLIADDFRQYTADEILSLPKYHAIVRMGESKTVFNVATNPPPPPTDPNPVPAIREHCRQHYAQPRHTVEATFATNGQATSRPATPKSAQATATHPERPADDPSQKTLADDEWDAFSDFTS